MKYVWEEGALWGKVIQWALRCLVTVMLIFLGYGCFIFPHKIENFSQGKFLRTTEGIVIFTGEIEREKTAILLYRLDFAKKLHISGRFPGFRLAPCKNNLSFDCAPTTKKNVELTHQWITENHLRSVRLVTADYHMPRSLFLAKSLWKNVTIVPHPVRIHRTGLLGRVWAEYLRYVGALVEFYLFKK